MRRFTLCADFFLNSSVSLMASFDILNPEIAQASPSSIKVEGGGAIYTPQTPILKPGEDDEFGVPNGKDPLKVVYWFLKRSIAQRTPLAGVSDNVVTVTLQANVDVPVSAKVTISGLVGAGISGPVVLTDFSGSAFVEFCSNQLQQPSWSGTATGILVFTVCQVLEKNQEYVFRFDVANPNEQQASPEIFIEASWGLFSGIPRAKMQKNLTALVGVEGGSAPLMIVQPSFTTAVVSQSSPLASARNTFTIELTPNMDLDDATVIVSGFVGARPCSHPVSITMKLDGASTNDEVFGDFRLDSGGITFQVQQLKSLAQNSFSFQVRNPSASTQISEITVQATGSNGIDAQGDPDIVSVPTRVMNPLRGQASGVMHGQDPSVVRVVSDPAEDFWTRVENGTCGDGFIDPGEECDDGNVDGKDGCSAMCTCEDAPCTIKATTSSPLSSLVAGLPPGSTIELQPGTYDQPEHCYLVFKHQITLLGKQVFLSKVRFSCSICSSAAIVLAASDVHIEGIEFDGLTIMSGEAVQPSLTLKNCDVKYSARSFLEMEGTVDEKAVDLQSGLHITGSKMLITLQDAEVSNNNGGGIYFDVTLGVLRLLNVQVISNEHQFASGGGIRVVQGSMSATGCNIRGNTANEDGGAISFESEEGSLNISQSSVTENIANRAGGGISAVSSGIQSSASLFIDRTLFDSNKGVQSDGGALRASVGYAEITGCNFSNNNASSLGGGVSFQASYSEVTIRRCNIEGSTAVSGAGLSLKGTVTIEQCGINNNVADSMGAALVYDGSGMRKLTLRDTIVQGNTAQRGSAGGVLVQDGDAWIEGCVFHGNQASDEGGGLRFTGISGLEQTWLVEGTTFDGNSALRGGGLSVADVHHQVSHDSNVMVGSPMALLKVMDMDAGETDMPHMHGVMSHTVSNGANSFKLFNSNGKGFSNSKNVPIQDNSRLLIAMSKDKRHAIYWEKAQPDPITGQIVNPDSYSNLVAVTLESVGFFGTWIEKDVNDRIEAQSDFASVHGNMFPIAVTHSYESNGILRFRPGWGISKAVADSGIYLATADRIIKYSIADQKFSYLTCDRSEGEAFTSIAVGKDGDVFVSKYTGVDIAQVAQSKIIRISKNGICGFPSWDVTQDFQLVRSMSVSSDGLFLITADQTSAVSGGDEFQQIKSTVLSNGFTEVLKQVSASQEQNIILRNIVDIDIQESAGQDSKSVDSPRRIIVLQDCICTNLATDPDSCPCGTYSPSGDMLTATNVESKFRVSYVSAVGMEIKQCSFLGNAADVTGGAAAMKNLPFGMKRGKLSRINVDSNSAGLYGGGFSFDKVSRSFSIEDQSSFQGNAAVGDAESNVGLGGAVGIEFSAAVLIRDSLIDQSRAGRGGAVWFSSTRDFDPDYQPKWMNPLYRTPSHGHTLLWMQNVTISKTVSTDSTAGTGAMSLEGDVIAHLSANVFLENEAAFGAAIYASQNSSAYVSNSLFESNAATSMGAGIYFTGESMGNVLSSIFMYNSAKNGAAIAVAGSSNVSIATITSVKGARTAFTSNVATEDGGGVRAQENSIVLISDADFSLNSARNGGALSFAHNAAAEIEVSTIESNTAYSCGGGLATSSTVPVKMTGIVSFLQNQAENGASGGAVCSIVPTDGSLQCAANPQLSKFPFMLSMNSGELVMENNYAHSGGGGLFVKCIEPSGETLALGNAMNDAAIASIKGGNVYPPKGTTRFSFTGNTAGYGINVATLPEKLVLQDPKNVKTSYRPGEAISTVLQIRDSFMQTVKLDAGDILPVAISAQVCVDSCSGAGEKSNSIVELDQDGLCRVEVAGVPMIWPAVQQIFEDKGVKNELGVGVPVRKLRTFEPTLVLQHAVSAPLQGVTMEPVRLNISRLSCLENQQFVETAETGTGVCRDCSVGDYVVDPDQGECILCPDGGTCDGSKVGPKQEMGGNVIANTWEYVDYVSTNVQPNVVSKRARLLQCPPGYLLVRRRDDEPADSGIGDNPQLDQCSKCPVGRYSIVPADFYGEQVLVESDVKVAAIGQKCEQCPLGAVCNGGDQIREKTGFYRPPDSAKKRRAATGEWVEPEWAPTPHKLLDVGNLMSPSTWFGRSLWYNAPERIPLRSLPQRSTIGSPPSSSTNYLLNTTDFIDTGVRRAGNGENGTIKVELYPCPPGSCLEGGQCAEGKTGPVCAVCMQGWAMGADTCEKCSEDVGATVGIGATIALVLFFVVYYFVAWRPFFAKVPGQDDESEYDENDKTSDLQKMLIKKGWVTLAKRFGFFERLWLRNTVTIRGVIKGLRADGAKKDALPLQGLAKILIGFYQVQSSFLATFNIKWPKEQEDAMKATSIFRLDMLSMPGPSCVIAQFTYTQKLLAYTLLPPFFLFCLVAPLAVTMLMGKLRHGGTKNHPKYETVYANTWQYTVFFLFLYYPTVSVATIRSFSCQDVGPEGNLLQVATIYLFLQ